MIDFDTARLSGGAISLPPRHQFRGVKSNDRQAVTIYIEKLYHHLHSNNAFVIQTRLDTGDAAPVILELADKILGQGGDAADKVCNRRRPEFYFHSLIQQRLIVSSLAAHLSNMKRQRPLQLLALQARLQPAGIEIIFPSQRGAVL